jgi:hypothetical protein
MHALPGRHSETKLAIPHSSAEARGSDPQDSVNGGAHKAVKRWPGMPTHREGALDRQRLPLPDPHWKVPFSRTEPGTEV